MNTISEGMTTGHRIGKTLTWLLLPLGAVSGVCSAFSLGSPVCEVAGLPLVPMSPTLASPAPSGWTLQSRRSIYYEGQTVALNIVNPDASKTALGVLIWAVSGPSQGSGAFLTDGSVYQHVPLPAECGQWALTHTMPTPKPQDALRFSWVGGSDGSVILRAFLIEDCGIPGGCRSHQALTPFLSLQQVLFYDSFGD